MNESHDLENLSSTQNTLPSMIQQQNEGCTLSFEVLIKQIYGFKNEGCTALKVQVQNQQSLALSTHSKQ